MCTSSSGGRKMQLRQQRTSTTAGTCSDLFTVTCVLWLISVRPVAASLKWANVVRVDSATSGMSSPFRTTSRTCWHVPPGPVIGTGPGHAPGLVTGMTSMALRNTGGGLAHALVIVTVETAEADIEGPLVMSCNIHTFVCLYFFLSFSFSFFLSFLLSYFKYFLQYWSLRIVFFYHYYYFLFWNCCFLGGKRIK